MNKGGFSWKRLTGITKIKSSISRSIGIPLTRSGRQRKLGSAIGCCSFWVFCFTILVVMQISILFYFI